jgi:putative phosphonate metabolism protein
MRYAIYFTPAKDSPLTRLAASWLGRDPFTGASVPPPSVAGFTPGEIAFHTAAARRYGFHATLKAPFLLAATETEARLAQAVAEFAAATEPFVVPRLAVGQIDRFFALLLTSPVAELDALAGNAVKAFDRFRMPLTEGEIERRNPDALSAEEFRNLCQWGYPYVFDTFRFHMTLTGRVAAGEAGRVHVALDEVFGAVLTEPVPVDGVALFVEPEAGAPFTIHSWRSFEPRRHRKTA